MSKVCLGSLLVSIRKKIFYPPIEAINTLYSRDYLKQDSTVINISLGYSTLIQLTQNSSVCTDMACSCKIRGWRN